MTLEITKEQAKAIIELIKRSQISGAEAPAVVDLFKLLNTVLIEKDV